MSSIYPSLGGAAARQCIYCSAPLAPNESQCSRCGTYNQLPPQGQQFGTFQPGVSSGTPGLSWGSQPAQSPQQFPQTGNESWLSNTGSTVGWGPAGQASAQPQSNLFAGQNQQPMPSQQLPQGLFPPFGTGQLGQGQPGFSNPNQSPLNNSFASFQQNPNQSSLNSSFASFQQNPDQSSFNSFFSTTQQNNHGTSRAGTGLLNGQVQRNWQAYQLNQSGNDNEDEDEDKKKRPNVLAIVGIIMLVLALVGGGTFGAFYFLRHSSSTNNTVVTPTIVTPSTTPLFSDSFQNNANGWDLTQPTGASISLSGGKLLLESDNNKLFQELLPGGKTWGDLRVDVDANLTKGDQANGYGIYIRGALAADGSLGTYYRFEAYGDGTFAVYMGVQNADGTTQSNTLKAKAVSNAILYAGQTNHLTVIAKGPQMTFLINNVIVTTFTDDSYKSGAIALFVSNVSGVKPGAQATFTHLAIFPPS
jgi:hypothetical protein